MTLEDPISDLPDDILRNIFSLLTLQQAVATSVLSRKWRFLWKRHLLSLNFRCDHKKFPNTDAFIQMVDQVIKAYESPTLLEFSLDCRSYSQSSTDYINRWIAFAISRGVSKLRLELGYGWKRYPMPPNLFTETNGIEPYLNHLGCISSNLTSSFVSHSFFETIKELHLFSVNFSEEVLDAILYRCSFLEHLYLDNIGELMNAKPAVPPPRLRHLEVYFMKDLENLELLAPSLVSFKYHGPKININFIDSPGLVDVSIVSFRGLDEYKYTNDLGRPYPEAHRFVFGQFAVYLSQLKYLLMDASYFTGKETSVEVPVLSSLKQLSIYTSYLEHFRPCYRAVTSFLEASPLLERLELHLPSRLCRKPCKEKRKLKLTPVALQKNLKEVWISGFLGESADMILVKYILKHAPALQNIGITACGAQWWLGCMDYEENNCPISAHCFFRIHRRLPSGARLTIFER